jgi:hypothetical protein
MRPTSCSWDLKSAGSRDDCASSERRAIARERLARPRAGLVRETRGLAERARAEVDGAAIDAERRGALARRALGRERDAASSSWPADLDRLELVHALTPSMPTMRPDCCSALFSRRHSPAGVLDALEEGSPRVPARGSPRACTGVGDSHRAEPRRARHHHDAEARLRERAHRVARARRSSVRAPPPLGTSAGQRGPPAISTADAFLSDR